MPTSQDWLQVITDDVNRLGVENATMVQAESFAFKFKPSGVLPPILTMVGESDILMAQRDFKELGRLVVASNTKSQSLVVKNAWHNHSIDIPQRFAAIIDEWVQEILP